jgi:beta-lactamase superfamily II metal-dependent hydrolase
MTIRATLASLLVFALVVSFQPHASMQARKSLDIYYVDVEGGGATLFVSPSGQSMLVDTGFPRSIDADRIMVAAKLAGLKQIDYLVTSHFHLDHVGGVPELAARIPIRNFVDHGLATATELKDNQSIYDAYLKVREKGRHMAVKPGDAIPIADLDVRVVSSGGKVITRPLEGAGAPNPLCADFVAKEEAPMLAGENGRSVGVVVKYGKFRTIDLGDLTWNREHELACPNNLVGPIDVYLTTHHGLSFSGPKVIVHAMRPKVTVMNNGATKGTAEAWQIIRESPGMIDIWQNHQLIKLGPDRNAPDQFVANLGDGKDCAAHWIKVSARADGSFTVTNSRNGFTKTYKSQS